jgi:hypothetical protein
MCPVSRGAFFGIRVPRLKNENHDAAAVRRCTFAFVMHGFAFGNHNQTLGARRGTVRSRRASRSGIAELGPRRPKPVRNAFIRPHRIGRTTHPSPARSPTHRGPAFTRWRSLNADERNPGLPIPHRAGGLTRHIYSYISTESSFKVNTTFLLHATLQVQRSRQIVSSIHATT